MSDSHSVWVLDSAPSAARPVFLCTCWPNPMTFISPGQRYLPTQITPVSSAQTHLHHCATPQCDTCNHTLSRGPFYPRFSAHDDFHSKPQHFQSLIRYPYAPVSPSFSFSPPPSPDHEILITSHHYAETTIITFAISRTQTRCPSNTPPPRSLSTRTRPVACGSSSTPASTMSQVRLPLLDRCIAVCF